MAPGPFPLWGPTGSCSPAWTSPRAHGLGLDILGPRMVDVICTEQAQGLVVGVAASHLLGLPLAPIFPGFFPLQFSGPPLSSQQIIFLLKFLLLIN